MLTWYLRQPWPRQLLVLGSLLIVTPIAWTALASLLFVDLMKLRTYYPRGDIGSYTVWWDYLLADSQTLRTQRWLMLSAVVAALPFAAFIVRQVMDYVGGGAKRPAVYGKTAWASRQDIRSSGISSKRRPF